jgi:hypothetical protein
MMYAPLAKPFLALPLVVALVGCGGSGKVESAGSSPPAKGPSATVPSVTEDARQGRYVGTVTIGGVDYYGDALITADGLVRLYIGGPYVSDGTVQTAIHTASAQLVGTMAPDNSVDGNDRLIGQGCSGLEDSFGWCSAAEFAKHSFSVKSGNLQGEIVVETDTSPSSTLTWPVKLTAWSNYYDLPAKPAGLTGQYREELADFAQAGDTIISVDGSDSGADLYFHSASSGCTGSGELKPHLDGSFNVYDVSLSIFGCLGPYSYLNTEFEGLATTSPSAAWDYDVVLRMWLLQRRPDFYADVPPPALTMSARVIASP